MTTWTEPGDLDRMFWNIVGNETYQQLYNVTVLSGPAAAVSNPSSLVNEDYPWVIQMENFLTPAECNRLIALGHHLGFKRSKDIGKKKADGSFDSFISTHRTSTTAWCTAESICREDPVVKGVAARVENLVGIPTNNSENMQLLKYEVGQKYETHSDYSDAHIGRPQGVRILTVFLYLNDEGLMGGGTNFPFVQNMTVFPKGGTAVIWPSVLNDRPGVIDERTKHQALPVEKGVKYGANLWIHERDFQTPLLAGCAN